MVREPRAKTDGDETRSTARPEESPANVASAVPASHPGQSSSHVCIHKAKRIKGRQGGQPPGARRAARPNAAAHPTPPPEPASAPVTLQNIRVTAAGRIAMTRHCGRPRRCCHSGFCFC